DIWRARVEGTVASLLAADDKLFAVTREGRIYCFGARRTEPRTYPLGGPLAPREEDSSRSARGLLSSPDAWSERVRGLIERTGAHDGYCVVWGVGSGRPVAELLRQTSLHLIVVDPDVRQVQALRNHLQEMGEPSERVAVLAGNPLTFSLPPYL